MPVDTAKVAGRRTLKFNSLDEILADIEKLNQGNRRTLGNWSDGQILKHLTVPMAWCLDGAKLKAAWYMRLMGWMIKNRFLRSPMPPGFKLPKDFAEHLEAPPTTWEDGLQVIRSTIARMKAEPQRFPSPFLGELTREQWDQLHCRHCELHLSFILPES
jgi:hypothetical protein